MARIVKAHELQPHISQLISAKKQIGQMAIDLTLRQVFKIKKGGRVDFGGSEYQEAQCTALAPIKQNPDDPYGWWELAGESYLCQFNESLQLGDNQIGFLQSHPRLISSGAIVHPLWLKKLDAQTRTLLIVPRTGIRIKENARIAQLVVLEMDETLV